MAQLLLEFLSEEIPARMQKRAEEDLARLMLEKLGQAGFIAEAAKTFSTPRRLAIVVDGLPFSTPDVREERKGPRVGAPKQAVEGFLRGAGLASIEEAEVRRDAKGDFYVAVIEKPGRETRALIGEIVPEIVRAFPWPKSMRSGVSDLTWVRPLQNILCAFDGEEIAIRIDHVPSSAHTLGHRFHAPGFFKVKRFEDYAARLSAAHVMLDREERKRVILREAKTLCEARELELVEDGGLLEEVAGLVEWPVPVMGEMDPGFLALPSEVIRLTMRTHQKYFAVRDPGTTGLAPHFVAVANVEAKDGGRTIARGNARVLSARLNDARYFWDVDRFYDPIERTKPKALYNEERRKKLEGIVFHQKLGSVWDKVERVRALARELAPVVGADAALVDEAAKLCKMDLVTELVGEFPELQGYVGRELYLAQPPLDGEVGARSAPGGVIGATLKGEAREPRLSTSRASPPQSPLRGDSSPIEGEPGAHASGVASVAAAIEDHYRPLGPNDRVPTDPVAITVALADKLDTLVGFWAIDEKPTGSSDPYALRRAGLGIIRLLRSTRMRISILRTGLPSIYHLMQQTKRRGLLDELGNFVDGLPFGISAEVVRAYFKDMVERHQIKSLEDQVSTDLPKTITVLAGIRDFLIERLEVSLRDEGKRAGLIRASIILRGKGFHGDDAIDDDLVRIVTRVDALTQFLATENGEHLLAGYKRAANILRAEERKDDELSTLLQKGELEKKLDAGLFCEPEERALHDALEISASAARQAVEKEDFAGAMAALAKLRAPVDLFFDAVLVNDPDRALRLNRLALLARIRAALHEVADFSKIEG